MYICIHIEIKEQIDTFGKTAENHPVYQIIANVNAEGAGGLTFEDFLHLFTPKVNKDDKEENINKIFDLFDDDKKDYISIQNLRRIARELNS